MATGTSQAKPGSSENPMTIGYLIRGTSSLLERALGEVYIQGEVLSLKTAPSGHLYFALQSDNAQVSCVMWKGDARRLTSPLKNGMDIVAQGRPGIFERDGRFQMYLRVANEAGLGKDALALAELKKKLTKEGLFALDRKKPLPKLPKRIGVVTSKTGAAVRDIIQTIHRRFPVPILIADARVQGSEAAKELARGIERLSQTDVDVIIVGRGGGSASDLAAFNEEIVVRAVAACPIPIVSAVGHEVDISLCDLAADHRAATPTMAGEIVTPVREELRALIVKEQSRLQRELLLLLRNYCQELDYLREKSDMLIQRYLQHQRKAIETTRLRLEGLHPRTKLLESRNRIDELLRQIMTKAERRLEQGRRDLATLAGRLNAMSPLRVLERGYALAIHKGLPVRAASLALEGQAIQLRLSEGELECKVTKATLGRKNT